MNTFKIKKVAINIAILLSAVLTFCMVFFAIPFLYNSGLRHHASVTVDQFGTVFYTDKDYYAPFEIVQNTFPVLEDSNQVQKFNRSNNGHNVQVLENGVESLVTYAPTLIDENNLVLWESGQRKVTHVFFILFALGLPGFFLIGTIRARKQILARGW